MTVEIGLEAPTFRSKIQFYTLVYFGPKRFNLTLYVLLALGNGQRKAKVGKLGPDIYTFSRWYITKWNFCKHVFF